VWSYLQVEWGTGSRPEMLKAAKKKFQGPCFVKIIILACWSIWKQRNNLISKGIKPAFEAWKSGFILEISFLKHRVKPSILPLLSRWIDNFL
jgi:hypothetical protein